MIAVVPILNNCCANYGEVLNINSHTTRSHDCHHHSNFVLVTTKHCCCSYYRGFSTIHGFVDPFLFCVRVFIVLLPQGGGLAGFSYCFEGYLEGHTVYVYIWLRIGDHFYVSVYCASSGFVRAI